MYERLDTMIMAAIKEPPLRDKPLRFVFFMSKEIGREASRIAEATGRFKDRVIDGRLQALRRKGVIRYSPERGWIPGIHA